ncbi:methyltransferase family protein [Actinocorallia herbida]|uniref:Methyltransferase family protein n=1 Tax=Actinocorallia herbida TaxID=58109 RepID=A0A3N1CZV9_9ACTN|nr:class I SAM-dependent methyltransferase [Actinocorallia herbida]ROO86810.1 methyltransferase family protein [Actinocorallia herbida]
MGELLGADELARSSVVANCAMNRERGPASYRRELGFDVLGFLAGRLEERGAVRWLDLCCGAGRALSEAAPVLGSAAELVGLDLVGFFAPAHPRVRLETASIADWAPDGPFDLITCVHGLHYVGDKLDALSRAASWLTADGSFHANLDLAGIHAPRRPLAASLRANGFSYDARRRRITCTGRHTPRFPFAYLGADDRTGPNYTGQDAVTSYYDHSPS